MRHFAALFIALLLASAIIGSAQAQQLVVKVDKDRYHLGETVKITGVVPVNQTALLEVVRMVDNRVVFECNVTGGVNGSFLVEWQIPGDALGGSYTVYLTLGEEKAEDSFYLVLPAIYKVTKIKLYPPQLAVGWEVIVTAYVANVGGERGNYTMYLKVNGTVVDSKVVSIPPGGYTKVNFTFKPTKEGKYIIEVDGKKKKLEVLPPPQLTMWLVDLAILLIAVIGMITLAFLKIYRG